MSNPMRTIAIEKVVISAGATGDNLTKSKKLLELISGRKAQIIASAKRIPDFAVRPGLEVGTRVTVRHVAAIALLKRLLGAIDNRVKKASISNNHFSFGIKEYIEIPGVEYQRELGIRGLNVTVTFARPGLRIQRKKNKSGKVPKKQTVGKEEIELFMQEGFKTAVI
jgi:large subunit ribosomal protein L5